MEDILFVLLLLPFFALGYFVMGRLGKFLDEHYRSYPESEERDRNVFIAETKGKSAEEVTAEVSAMLDLLQNNRDYEIIICGTVDPRIIESLRKSGRVIQYSIRQ